MALIIPAIRFEQKGTIMYLTALPVEELDYCSIDQWDPHKTGKWKGYQRGLIQKKINDLAEYLERPKGILPVAGMLNIRQKHILKFDGKKTIKPSHGTLTIPDYTRLWVVDMQHRLEGIRLASSKGVLGSFSVPVLITEGLKDVEEAAQFYVINTRARKMGVDLTRRLLIEHNEIKDITDVKPWELKAVQITIKLNKHLKKNNPWYKRIKEPESERMKEHIATEKSFVPSLKWLLTAPGIKNKSASHLARFMANYWEGLRLCMPIAFETPRSYLIQKTPGFMAFHRLAPIIYRKTRHGKRSVATFKRLFKVFLDSNKYGAKFWYSRNMEGAKKYGTGQSAYANLAMELQKKLK